MLETILGILITIVLIAIAVIISKLWPTLQVLLPNWATGILVTMADVFVRWAEKEYNGERGDAKFLLVLEKLEGYLSAAGIQIDTEIIKAAIEAAWSKMNAEQLTAGLKESVPKEE